MRTTARAATALVLLLALTSCAAGALDADPDPTSPAASSPQPSESQEKEPAPPSEPAPETVSFVAEGGLLSYDHPADWELQGAPANDVLAYSERLLDDDVVTVVSMQQGTTSSDVACDGSEVLLASQLVDPLPDGVTADGGALHIATWDYDGFVIVAMLDQAQLDEGCMGEGGVRIGDALLTASTPYRSDSAGDLWNVGGEHATLDALLASDEYAATIAMFASLEVLALP